MGTDRVQGAVRLEYAILAVVAVKQKRLIEHGFKVGAKALNLSALRTLDLVGVEAGFAV
jgi:hypothetical protein